MMNIPGKEHYTLIHYLTRHYGDTCRHVVDIGTRFVASALALGASGVPVHTFDLKMSKERYQAFLRHSYKEDEWQKSLQQQKGPDGTVVNITFHNVNLLTMDEQEFKKHMTTWLIMLDTAHLPDSIPFEREFLKRLKDIKFAGVLVLDDIHLNEEMRKWWKEVQQDATNMGIKTYDATSVGHFSGTGIVDFSGMVESTL